MSLGNHNQLALDSDFFFKVILWKNNALSV